MKTIGILGGLGPESTCEYYRYITRTYYDTFGNYAYPEIIIYSLEFSKFIDCGYDNAEDIRLAIEKLHSAGADFVIAACNSIHIVYDEVSKNIPIPWVSIMDVVAGHIKKTGNINKVGLLGTNLTMTDGFYHKALEKHGIETIIPEKAADTINDIIFNELVRGITRDDSKKFVCECMESLHSEGAQGIVLGCTELPFLINQGDSSLPIFDTTALHAQWALDLAVEKISLSPINS